MMIMMPRIMLMMTMVMLMMITTCKMSMTMMMLMMTVALMVVTMTMVAMVQSTVSVGHVGPVLELRLHFPQIVVLEANQARPLDEAEAVDDSLGLHLYGHARNLNLGLLKEALPVVGAAQVLHVQLPSSHRLDMHPDLAAEVLLQCSTEGQQHKHDWLSNQPTNQPTKQPTNQACKQPANQQGNRTAHQLCKPPTKHPTTQAS